jgi:hypothetical protein
MNEQILEVLYKTDAIIGGLLDEGPAGALHRRLFYDGDEATWKAMAKLLNETRTLIDTLETRE